MKKRIQKIASVLLCGMLCTALLGGCSGSQASADGGNGADSQAEVSGQSGEGEDAAASGEGSDAKEAADAENGAGDSAADAANTDSIGEFTMQDIAGETYTQEMFADYDVTMVNIFATWCTPCINEIPDLEQLKNDMADQGVNVVGIVLDAVDAYGNTDGGAIEKAGLLAEQTGAAYPFLVPDETLLNGRLYGIEAVPETLFVDSEGNIIGESYVGSRSLEEWKAVVEEKLADVGGADE